MVCQESADWNSPNFNRDDLCLLLPLDPIDLHLYHNVQEAYENEVERAYQKRLDQKTARPLERIVHRLDGRLETIICMGAILEHDDII